MDCTIPGHSVRTFSSAIQCLSKIGKDLYIDFDPMDGLTLRALNDAKSAFSAVEFAPRFFERCTAPTTAVRSNNSNSRKRKQNASTQSSNNNNNNNNSSSQSSQQDSRFSCRVPMRALVPVVRPRKGVMTLRIKSEGHDGDGNRAGNDETNDNTSTTASAAMSLQLAFEFELEVPNTSNSTFTTTNTTTTGSTNQTIHNTNKSTVCKVIHRTRVAEVDNITAVAPKEHSSELVAAPKVLLNWLEPIKRTAEGCLIFTKDADTIVATSFNSTDTAGTNVALTTARQHILKTETSINVEDLDDYDFQDSRTIVPTDNTDDDDDDDDHERDSNRMDPAAPNNCPVPSNVNDEVVLVFGMKEAKALLQFCSSNSAYQQYGNQGWDNLHDEQGGETHHHRRRHPWSVVMSFHWAGRPLVLESNSQNGVSIQLVLATLSHEILKGLPMMQERERSQQQQQTGRRQSAG